SSIPPAASSKGAARAPGTITAAAGSRPSERRVGRFPPLKPEQVRRGDLQRGDDRALDDRALIVRRLAIACRVRPSSHGWEVPGTSGPGSSVVAAARDLNGCRSWRYT